MRIECFTPREWYKIADTISAHCPSEPLVEKLVQQIYEKTDLFTYTHDSVSYTHLRAHET